MIAFLGDISQFILSNMSSVFNVYTASSILSGFFALYLMDRMFHIFDILRR